ncbi:MAG: hypothetical protein AAGA56_27890, partial [Myxococcota bacterium]
MFPSSAGVACGVAVSLSATLVPAKSAAHGVDAEGVVVPERGPSSSMLRATPPETVTSHASYRYWTIAGATTFSTGWLATIVLAGAFAPGGERGAAIGQATIPLAGPVVLSAENAITDDFASALPILALSQGVGALVTTLGLTLESEVLGLGDDADDPDDGEKIWKSNLHVVPELSS